MTLFVHEHNFSVNRFVTTDLTTTIHIIMSNKCGFVFSEDILQNEYWQ